MAGSTVAVTFDDAFTETVTWASLGFGQGIASGTGWNLHEGGDTDTQTWVWVNTRGVGLTKIVFTDPTNRTIWKRQNNNPPITADRTPGVGLINFSFELRNITAAFTAVYSVPVGLFGNAPIANCDVFQILTVNFTDPGGMTASDSGSNSVGFHSNTDGCLANVLEFQDQPTAANGTSLATHNTDVGSFPWQVATPGSFEVQSNTIQPTSDVDGDQAFVDPGGGLTGKSFIANCMTTYASANNAERANLVFNYADANNYYYADWQADNSVLKLVKRVAGVETVIATSSQSSVSGVFHTIECLANGASDAPYLFFDGALVIRGSDSALAATSKYGILLRKVGTPGGFAHWANLRLYNP